LLRTRGDDDKAVVRLDGEATLDRILNGASIARYGDGELQYCLRNRPVRFQKWNSGLAGRLKETLIGPPANVIVGFNHYFRACASIEWITAFDRYPKTYTALRTVRSENDIGVLRRPREKKLYDSCWREIVRNCAATEYGEASVFFLGTYVRAYRNGTIPTVLDRFRALFNGRRLLFVCPDTPLRGLSFRDQEETMRRIGLRGADYISIPPVDAYDALADIEGAILSRRGFDAVFIQAGPLATILAADLTTGLGCQVLDVGSLNTQIRYLL
jgi:hypothetical protein